MDTVLEKVFPFEGIPEIILSFSTPEEKHEKGSKKLIVEMEKIYRRTNIYDRTIFNDKFHSYDDLPANQYYDNGIVISEWYKYGKLHRDKDLPAVTKCYIYENMSSIYESMPFEKYWFKNGRCTFAPPWRC